MASLSREKRITPPEWIAYVSVALYAVWSLVRIISTSAPDFSVLYQSAVNLLHGKSLYHDDTLYTGLGYPQVSLLPYLPFTLIPYMWAQAVWIVGSFVAFAGACALCLHEVHRYSRRGWCMLMVVAFMAFPTKFTFGMGQANYYALFFLLLGISDYVRAPWLRSVFLLLALLFKPHLVFVYIGLFLTKRKIDVLWSFVAVMVAIVLLGTMTGWVNDRVYLRDTIPQLLEYRGRELYYNQSIQAGAARLFGFWGQRIAQVVALIVLILSFSRIRKSKAITPIRVLGILLPMQLLIEPLAWQHHLVFLLPTFVFLWPKSKWFLLLAYVLVAWNIKNPLYWQGNPLENIILSHGVWGLALLWYFAWKYI